MSFVQPPSHFDMNENCAGEAIDLRNLVHHKILDSGNTSTVSIVSDVQKEKYFILKKVIYDKGLTNSEPAELVHLKRLQESGVIGINRLVSYGGEGSCCLDGNGARTFTKQSQFGEFWMLLEKRDTDLLDYLNDCWITEDDARTFTKQLLRTLVEMHQKANLIQMDLKLENILFDKSSGAIELCDFGYCVPTTKTCIDTIWLGTDIYTAPELFNNICYPTKSVTWSLGVVVYLMMHTQLPWTRYQGDASVNDLTFSEGLSSQYQQFVLTCLQPDIKNRIDLMDVQSLEWLQQ